MMRGCSLLKNVGAVIYENFRKDVYITKIQRPALFGRGAGRKEIR